MGIANKIMYDEVPAGTDPLAPESKVIFAVGPLTASGVPLAGRTTLAHLSTFTKDHLVVDSHMGGMFGAKLKLAGWDALIVEGASDVPVFIKIIDGDITIDLPTAYGALNPCRDRGAQHSRLRQSVRRHHRPRGRKPAAVLQYHQRPQPFRRRRRRRRTKKCKAVVVEGNGSVYVKDPKAVAELSDYMLADTIGSNNNHVVPSTQQEWAEFYDEGSRWTARDGLTWALAEGGPINTGEPKPGELNTVGYRCMKSTKDLGPAAEKYTVKMNGCHSCPIHCYSDLRVEAAGSTAGFENSVGNTCAANFPVSIYMKKILGLEIADDESVLWDMTTQATMDNLGLWCNYAQLYRDIAHCYRAGVFEKNLPAEEYASINWAGFENESKDPTVMVEEPDEAREERLRTRLHRLRPLGMVRALERPGLVRHRHLHADQLPRLARASRHRVLRPGRRRVQHDVQPRRHDPLRRQLPGPPAFRGKSSSRSPRRSGAARRPSTRTRTTRR